MRQYHLLLVEDSSLTRHVLASFFTGEGFRVTQAADGQAALEMLATTVPDFILTDLTMPRLDGLGLLRHVRERWPTLPVVLCTAAPSSEIKALTQQLGVTAYIAKPLDLEKLLARILALLGTSS